MVTTGEGMCSWSKEEKLASLKHFGWSHGRTVELPSDILIFNIPENVKKVIKNIHGLEFNSITGRKRIFQVDSSYLDDFEDEARAAREETGLKFQFFPLGQMSEFSGVLVLDQFARFFRIDDGDVYFYGNNLEDFCDVVIFNNRTALEIRDQGLTYYCYNNQCTDIYFDVLCGWKGDNILLYPLKK